MVAVIAIAVGAKFAWQWMEVRKLAADQQARELRFAPERRKYAYVYLGRMGSRALYADQASVKDSRLSLVSVNLAKAFRNPSDSMQVFSGDYDCFKKQYRIDVMGTVDDVGRSLSSQVVPSDDLDITATVIPYACENKSTGIGFRNSSAMMRHSIFSLTP